MPKTLPRKALIAISSFSGAIYPGGLKTGLFYTEALHPFEVLTDAGFEVDLASETGTCGIDQVSLMLQFLSGSDKRFLATKSIRSMSSFTRNSRRPRS
jgi:D-lactate dehydratase